MKIRNTISILAASIAMSSAFLAHAQNTQKMDEKTNMEMTKGDQDGKHMKAETMKMAEGKSDKMTKDGMGHVNQSADVFKDLYRGR